MYKTYFKAFMNDHNFTQDLPTKSWANSQMKT